MAAQGALMIPIGFHGSDVFALLRSLSFFRSTCQGLMSAIIHSKRFLAPPFFIRRRRRIFLFLSTDGA